MVDLDQIIAAGTLLIIETGEYSDQSWHGPVRMTRDATKRELADAYRAQWVKGPDYWNDGPKPGDFLPWLVKAGHAEHVDNVQSWHVGSYGQFEP